MAEAIILSEGEHKKLGDKLLITSTISLIKSDKIIIVDTGYFLDKAKIIKGLNKENLSVEDVDLIVITHMHIDHIINLNLFPNAKVIDKFKKNHTGRLHKAKEGIIEDYEVSDGTKIADGVELLLTPGHTDDSISVVVRAEKGTIVIASDAIAKEEWADLNNIQDENKVINMDDYENSRKKILQIADYIIPGHGKMFKVRRG